MANFRIYNVQLLPNNSLFGDIGVVGYKKIFAEFRERTNRARIDKNLLAYHRDVGRESHFGPQEFHPKSGYIWGKFVKYKRTDKVDDLNTMKPIFKEGNKQVGVASVHEMFFVFDCSQHFLAIEEAGGALPPTHEFTGILRDYLRPICTNFYPDHSLHILLIADKNSLDVVLSEAIGFSRIEVDIAAPNGDAEDSLEQLKRSRIQNLSIIGSPGGNGAIANDLPPFLLGVIKGAVKYGRTKLSYLREAVGGKGEPVKVLYDSATTPMKFQKRQGQGESDGEFAERCLDDLRIKVAEISPNNFVETDI
jgi:hypothetical protein